MIKNSIRVVAILILVFLYFDISSTKSVKKFDLDLDKKSYLNLQKASEINKNVTTTLKNKALIFGSGPEILKRAERS